MTVQLLTKRLLEGLSLKGGCTGSSESTLVKCHIAGNHMPRLIFDCIFVQGRIQDFWKGGSYVEMAVVRLADLISFFLNIPWK